MTIKDPTSIIKTLITHSAFWFGYLIIEAGTIYLHQKIRMIEKNGSSLCIIRREGHGKDKVS